MTLKRYSNCMEVREDFSSLLDDELNSDERDQIEGHLAECADCLRELDALKRVDVLYRDLEPMAAPAGFEEQVSKAVRPRTLRFPLLGGGASARWMSTAVGVAAVLVLAVGAVFFALPDSESDRFETARLLTEEMGSVSNEPIMQRLLADDAPALADVAAEAPNPGRSTLPEIEAERQAATFEAGERFDPAPVETGAAWDSFVQTPKAEVTSGALSAASEVDEVQALREQVDQSMEETRRELREEMARAQTVNAPEESFDERDQLKALGYLGGASEKKMDDADLGAQTREFADDRAEVLGAPSASTEVPSALPAEPMMLAPMDEQVASGGADGDVVTRDRVQGKPIKTVMVKSYTIGREGEWIQKGYDGEPTTKLTRDSDELRFLVQRHGGDMSDISKRPARCIFKIEGRWYDLEAAPETF